MFPRLSLAIVVCLSACLLAQSANPTLDDRDVHTSCGSPDPNFPWVQGCVANGSGGPLDIQSIGSNTQTNGAVHGHPAPTVKQPPQTTPPPTHPTASRTGGQQQNPPTATNGSSRSGSPISSSTGVSSDQSPPNNLKQASGTNPSVTPPTFESSNSKNAASQSLTQLPSSSSSLGGALQTHGASKGRMVAAILVSILGVIIIVAAVYLIRRRRRRHRHSTSKMEVLIATHREQEREPSIHDPRYQRNRGFYLFNHTHQPDDEEIDVERHLSRTSYSSSSFSLTTSADTIMEEKLNFRLNHPL